MLGTRLTNCHYMSRGELEWLFTNFLTGRGIDFSGVNSLVTFTPANQGQTQCREITVTDDLLCEGDETIQVLLSTNEEPSEVRLSPPTATVVITDNDCMSLHYTLHKIMFSCARVSSSYQQPQSYYSESFCNLNVKKDRGNHGCGKKMLIL